MEFLHVEVENKDRQELTELQWSRSLDFKQTQTNRVRQSLRYILDDQSSDQIRLDDVVKRRWYFRLKDV